MGGVLSYEREADYQSFGIQRDKLIEIMESEFGLPEKLLKMRALSHRQVEKISYAVTREEKNEMILNCILQNGKHQDLIKALSDTFQTHLVNYINSNGVYRSEFGLDWPLTEKEHEILNDNEELLIDILETWELLPKLYSKHVINVKQRNVISSRTSDQARNEALLRMIRRLSKASYLTLIQCLRESHQAHIADLLENGGALVRCSATLETDNLDETEAQIANEFTNLLMQRTDSTEQANRVLNAVQLNIIAVRRGQSIVIYICCSTEVELDRVCKMIYNSEMKYFLQYLFYLLTHNLNFKVLSVKIYESDISKAREMFRKIPAEVEIFQMESTTIGDLPLEIIDVIIQKSFAIFISIISQIDDEKDQDGFKQLAEINVCWFKRMTNRRFKNGRWYYLSGICKRRNSISAFWKNSQQFIEENVIHLRTGANRLKRQDLLSDFQCALIARKSSIVKKAQSSNKSTNLSFILNDKNETNINLFIEYLRLSERRWIAKAMKHCGTSVRVEINSRSPIEDKKFTRFFEVSGSEILGSMKDRDFVRWIWCKSSDPKELQESKYLRHPFCHFVEESSQRENEIKINVDSDQLKRKAVVIPNIFDESFETIGEQVYAVGVTKLINEFYCLNYNGEMKVFSDRYPFVLQRKFQLKKIKRAYDIVSCEKENALYILDSHRYLHCNCVWKIKQNSWTNRSEIKWLELPVGFRSSTFSMSTDDQLLMVSRKPSPSLRIYGPDAQLHLEISLHQCIQIPIHAVETSTGNFVILHFLEKKAESKITTLSRDGKTIIHSYQPENEEQRLTRFGSGYLSIDSADRVFVADSHNDRVILLDSDLHWNQILFQSKEGKYENIGEKYRLYPRLYYFHGKKQVVCVFNRVVTVFFTRF